MGTTYCMHIPLLCLLLHTCLCCLWHRYIQCYCTGIYHCVHTGIYLLYTPQEWLLRQLIKSCTYIAYTCTYSVYTCTYAVHGYHILYAYGSCALMHRTSLSSCASEAQRISLSPASASLYWPQKPVQTTGYTMYIQCIYTYIQCIHMYIHCTWAPNIFFVYQYCIFLCKLACTSFRKLHTMLVYRNQPFCT